MKRNIHIHVHDAGWDESKHPRRDDGKFGSGSASSAKSEESVPGHTALTPGQLRSRFPHHAAKLLALKEGETAKLGGWTWLKKHGKVWLKNPVGSERRRKST
jgi:hypothetical protein